MAAVVHVNSLLNGKDSRWLQLEVCREFQRNKCTRQDTECKFAHPPANVEVQNGKVTACYDSIKGRCNRDKPPCKYFHPPQHLKDQLLINGRNHLALKNALMQQMGMATGQQVIPGQVPTVATNPYLTGIPANAYPSPYYAPGTLVPALLGPDHTQLGQVVPQAVQVAQQKIPRSDRLEVCREFMRGACKRAESECRFAHPQDSVSRHDDGSITVCMDAVKGRCTRDPCRYFHPPLHLQAQLKAAQSRATAVATAHQSMQQSAAVAAAAAAVAQQQAAQGTSPTNAVNAAAAAATAAAAAIAMSAVGAASGGGGVSGGASAHHHQHHQQLEVGKKRAAADNDMLQLMDVKTVGSFYYENFAFSGMVPFKRPAAEKSGIPVYQPGATTYQQLMQLQQPFVPVSSTTKVPLNASYVIYTDANGQLLDTLPVCQDFNRSMCSRLNCRFVHLTEDDKVEVCDQRVAVCRDHANGQCRRKQCKYYHIPIVLPPANVMAAITNTNGSNSIDNINNSNSNNNNIYNHISSSSSSSSSHSSISNTSSNGRNNNSNGSNSQNNQMHTISQQQHLQEQQKPAHEQYKQHAKSAVTAAATNYNNNLVIIEPQHQHLQQQQQQLQQQPQLQQHYNSYQHGNNYTTKNYNASSNNNHSLHNNNNKHSATTSTTHAIYQQQPATFHLPHFACHSPYSPSSASSSSSCSIATSPTALTSATTTLPTTSTVTMPTAHIGTVPSPPAAATAAYLKTAPPPTQLTAFASGGAYELAPCTPTLLLSSDYNSNCIPMLTAQQQHQQQQQSSINAATSYIYPSVHQQHLMKYAAAAAAAQVAQHQYHYAAAPQMLAASTPHQMLTAVTTAAAPTHSHVMSCTPITATSAPIAIATTAGGTVAPAAGAILSGCI
ncbi:uncharacterized protein mbl isoform X27 [Eurosta solidaginis]|uniref:uncharacterized protein mbl isoform X27 n=1 Tax=Eurosta solidaginis TaxID=178769 RepID=UPI00353106C2